MDGNFEALTIEKRDQVLWVRIHEGGRESDELIHVFRTVHMDPDIRAIVLTGGPEKAFCVGSGAASAPKDEMERNAYWVSGMQRARDLIVSGLECDKPIVGRINGHAIGKGCSIALICDITVMVEDSKIGDTHVKVGLTCGDGGSLLWPYIVGPMLAKRYLLTGDLLTGRQAEAIGLITEAVPRAELDARTQYWVERVQQGSPASVAMTKRAINAAIRAEATAHMDMSLGLETLSFMTRDHREGAAALATRQQPSFTGRLPD
jgi:enoyl-CoA hydratase